MLNWRPMAGSGSWLSRLKFIFAPTGGAKGTTLLDRLPLGLWAGAEDAWAARRSDLREANALALVERMCKAGGIDPPKLVIYQAPWPNASSLANGTVTLATETLDMPAAQLEALLGHELTHHRHKTRDFLAVTGLVGATHLASNLVARPALAKRTPNLAAHPAFKTVYGLGVLAADLALVTAYMRKNEFEADRGAAALTGKPGAVADMFDSLARTRHDMQREAAQHQAQAYARMPGWKRMIVGTVDELEPNWLKRALRSPLALLPTHPPTESRVARLRALEQEQADASAASSGLSGQR